MDYKTVAMKIIEIRLFEERLLDLFSKGELFGTTHTSIGQEGIAATLGALIDIEFDSFFSSHRCHGHYIALGGPTRMLLAEIMGRETGLCGGRGGSQHIKYKNFYSNGIQGGTVGNATGIALHKKVFERNTSISVVALGDGTLGQGIVYESFNFASKNDLPILYVIENNRYAQSTPTELTLAGTMDGRSSAFGLKYFETRSNDPRVLEATFQTAVSEVREKRKPICVIAHTYRLGPHSKGDDYRDPQEIAHFRESDPLNYAQDILGEGEFKRYSREVAERLEQEHKSIRQDPFPRIDRHRLSVRQDVENHLNQIQNQEFRFSAETFLGSINEGLDYFLSTFPSGFLMGEDLIDPYGGAFKVTKGLSTKYPDRVLPTGISEAGLMAWATGAALAGARPIIEIMFADFASLIYDQVLNHATKYPWIYDHQSRCAIIVRTASGGGRGYGPTHSQSIEKYFIGVQGLTIVAPSLFDNPGETLLRCTQTPGPTLFVEHKLLYPQRLISTSAGRYAEFFIKRTDGAFPVTKLSFSDVTSAKLAILCYSNMASLAVEAARELMMEHEVAVDIFIVSLLQPFQRTILREMLQDVAHLFILEENDAHGGWGADVISELSTADPMIRTYHRLASMDFPLPSSGPMEKQVLPTSALAVETILKAWRSS